MPRMWNARRPENKKPGKLKVDAIKRFHRLGIASRRLRGAMLRQKISREHLGNLSEIFFKFCV